MGAPATMIRTARGTAVGSINLWTGLGALGSAGIAVFGTNIGAVPRPGPDRYWVHFTGVGSTLMHLGFYAGVVMLLVAWVAVGLEARRGGLTVARCWVLLLCWGLPLFLGPPVFSRDIYSYVGQGLLAHLGLNPYHVAPSALGNGRQLASIAHVWRNTASPYGPLFVTLSRGTVTLAGRSLDAQVMAFRILELLGVASIMVFLPRLARRLGTDPGIALWLAALSPLALFSYVASGHNDALMVGLLVAGVALAMEDRLAVGVALCALGALIKLPAALAVVFLAVVALRRATADERWQVIVKAVVVPCAVLIVGTVLAGYGWAWLSPAALHVPAELRILHSPSVSLGFFFSAVVHLVGIPVSTGVIVSATQVVCGLVVVAGTLWLLWHAHRSNVVRAIGLALLLFAVGSPTLWPWYLAWGVTILAATTAQRSKMLAAVAGLAMLVVGAGGSPMLHGLAYVVTAPLLLAGCVWFFRDRHWRAVVMGNVD